MTLSKNSNHRQELGIYSRIDTENGNICKMGYFTSYGQLSIYVDKHVLRCLQLKLIFGMTKYASEVIAGRQFAEVILKTMHNNGPIVCSSFPNLTCLYNITTPGTRITVYGSICDFILSTGLYYFHVQTVAKYGLTE